MCVKWAEMNDRGDFLKPDIVSDFEFRSKCTFGAELRKESLREFKRLQTSFSGNKCIKNVWRPGPARTRWGSLSAPPDPLAVGVAASRPGRGSAGEVGPPLWKFLDPPVATAITNLHNV